MVHAILIIGLKDFHFYSNLVSKDYILSVRSNFTAKLVMLKLSLAVKLAPTSANRSLLNPVYHLSVKNLSLGGFNVTHITHFTLFPYECSIFILFNMSLYLIVIMLSF